jgi:PleD family two-component response regulator
MTDAMNKLAAQKYSSKHRYKRRHYSIRDFSVRNSPAPGEIRILLAEDNSTKRKIALAQSRKLGYVTRSAVNGLEMVKALEDVSYDIILMDCQMSEPDGYDANHRQTEQKIGTLERWKSGWGPKAIS